ncbi:MAG TPA: hypothetical protein PLJ82_08035 [Paludibacteraceae bacterium]|nr:hypothetical protein [Paludibacteraceae bacterium]
MPTLTIKRNYDLNFSALPISINSQHYKIKNGGELMVDVPLGKCSVVAKDSFGLQGNTLLEITENKPIKLYLQPRVSLLTSILLMVGMIYFYMLYIINISNTPWWFILSISFPVIYQASCMLYKSNRYYSFSQANTKRVPSIIGALYLVFMLLSYYSYIFFTNWLIQEHLFRAFAAFIGILGFVGLFSIGAYHLLTHKQQNKKQ